eukprot:360202-Chlamydomonas_euryale.AAC.7
MKIVGEEKSQSYTEVRVFEAVEHRALDEWWGWGWGRANSWAPHHRQPGPWRAARRGRRGAPAIRLPISGRPIRESIRRELDRAGLAPGSLKQYRWSGSMQGLVCSACLQQGAVLTLTCFFCKNSIGSYLMRIQTCRSPMHTMAHTYMGVVLPDGPFLSGEVHDTMP